MLFREFNIIAAAAYAAARTVATHKSIESLEWDELDQDQQNEQMRRVMAIARGEPEKLGRTDEDEVFAATATAILGYNNGQGGLALEEIATIGSTVLSLELLKEEEVSERNVRETVVELLHELAARREGALGLDRTALGTGQNGPSFFSSPRFQALGLLSRHFPDANVEAADKFAAFITRGGDEYDAESLNVLEQACQAMGSSKNLIASAENALGLANDYWGWLHPATPEPLELTAEAPAEAAELSADDHA